MKRLLNGRQALSPVVAAIMLIAVTIAVSITVAVYMGVLMFTPMDLDVRIDASIYSADHNIGVLNEDGAFSVSIRNYVNSIRTIDIVVDADEHVLVNETVVVDALSSKNLTINQKLLSLGSWTIRLYEDKEISDNQQFSVGKEVIGGYCFVTMLNEAEASMRINQLDDIRANRIRSDTALAISVLGLAFSAIMAIPTLKNIHARIRQYTRDRKSRREDIA